MAEIRVNPTRMELKKLKTRYATARRGHKLLKDKRDELMKQFLAIVRADKELREKIEAGLSRAYGSFSVAAAVSSPAMLEEAMILPRRQGELTVGYRDMMSVRVPTFSVKMVGARGGYIYGFAFTSGELDGALHELGEMTEDLIRLAELEKTAQLLAEEIERTRRRVNALEYIMMPQLQEGIKRITMKLDENERGNLTRLMKVKDMMLAAGRDMAQAEEDEEKEAE
ncbi:MAG: V-type ATP synthase subunit D [Clostridia bacterium]|nr:V-type ATP synthase subunit D [Clostridia bacterium]